MRAKRPSQTASLVAWARALAHEGFTTARGFSDPAVRSLLSPGWELARRFVARGLRRAKPEARARALAQFDVLPLRVLAIDAEIVESIVAGCAQIVILGAGLDTRAYRLDALANVDVFEVDHPATQAYKRRKAAALRSLARSLTHVAVDFEKESLSDRLLAAGFRTDRPTTWISEGVVMYLTDAALRASFDAVASLSAPGSVLIVNYHEPSAASRERRLLFALWREPQIGLRSRATMHEEIRRVGFEILRDSTPQEWAERFGAAPVSGGIARVARLVVARESP